MIDMRLSGSIGNRVDAEQAIDSANEAADHATDEAADRSCGLAADISAMRDAVRDALCLRRKRTSDGRNNETSE
jgi:hypothetical protein